MAAPLVSLLSSAADRKLTWHSCRRPTRLLHRATRDTFSVAAFHANCDNRGPTLVLIETEQGNIFGGATLAPWSSVGDYVADPSAFLFTLVNPCGVPPTKLVRNGSGDELYCDAAYGPTFGSAPDLHLSDNCNGGNTLSSTNLDGNGSFLNPTGFGADLFDGAQTFVVAEYEVFLLQQ
eukprot:TRINITY_DN696_c0_g1_i1.p4 TRINITY_DN696_c0_g1~~TRINITY_DN696_c0_g1_i1.p4  ORF type:complete len:178 (-),score=46.06 TRINITY_DN696_c0_g1_i1:1104-1637(-)